MSFIGGVWWIDADASFQNGFLEETGWPVNGRENSEMRKSELKPSRQEQLEQGSKVGE